MCLKIWLDLRSLDVAKLGSLDLEGSVPFESSHAHLSPNVLSFSITIRPDEQRSCILGILLDIICNILLVLGINVNILQ